MTDIKIDEEVDSVPMRETVKQAVVAMHEKFNREHSAFLLLAASEAGLDPTQWRPNVVTFTFDKVKS